MTERSDLDARFRAAIAAIDAGDVTALQQLLASDPGLACERLEQPGAWLRDAVGKALDGFFARPYLLWFVAEDPVRNGRLPANVGDIARTIIKAAEAGCAATLREQLDYALELVAFSWIARDSGVQIALINVLVDAGASMTRTPENALVNGNVEAAAHLVTRGAPLTLAAAVCLARWEDARSLAPSATAREKQFALTLAALRGNTDAVRAVIDLGADVNAVSPDLYSHATPLHHAVSSSSLATVKTLVAAGARLDARDTAYDGTPLGWAEYSRGKKQYDEIAAYLRSVGT